MRDRFATLLVIACASGCSIDPSGLGDDIALGDDAGVSPDGATQDASVLDASPTDGGTADATIVEASADAASDAFDVADARDAADTAPLDTSDARDAADSFVPDTFRPDTADTSVTDTRDAAVPCTEPGGVMYLGHCYFPLTTGRGQAAQESECKLVGAHLASITSAGEQGIVAGRGTADRWIGLVKDSAAPSAKTSFRWNTGESSQVYDNWAAGDPNGGHDCARMQANGQWGDNGCTNAFPAICERE